MNIAREEIFGPVLVVIPYEDDEDAIRIANDSIYGLSGGVSGADRDRVLRVARRIRTGTMSVNGGLWYGADVPFGGYKQSGIGREMGVAGFEEYLEQKAMAEPASKAMADQRAHASLRHARPSFRRRPRPTSTPRRSRSAAWGATMASPPSCSPSTMAPMMATFRPHCSSPPPSLRGRPTLASFSPPSSFRSMTRSDWPKTSACLDILSRGRAMHVLGIGHRPEEYEHFGLEMGDRGRLADENSSCSSACYASSSNRRRPRRAGVPPPPPYRRSTASDGRGERRSCSKGRPPRSRSDGTGQSPWSTAGLRGRVSAPRTRTRPSPSSRPAAPTAVFVTDDPARAWDELGPHILHDAVTASSYRHSDDSVASIPGRRRSRNCSGPTARIACLPWRMRPT